MGQQVKDCEVCNYWFEATGCIHVMGTGVAATCDQFETTPMSSELARAMFPECFPDEA